MGSINLSNSADNSDVILSDQSFAHAIAEGVHFDCAQLTRITFAHCDLYWASFFMAHMEDVTFDHCDLRGSDFKKARFERCRFINCDLGKDAIGGETQFEGANLSSVDFVNCRRN